MKKTRLTITTITVLLAATFAFSAYAKKGHGRHNGNQKQDMVLRMAEHLNLTAEQKTKIEKIVADSKNNNKATRGQLKTLRNKMHTAWQKENPDRNNIISIQKKMHSLRGKMAISRIDMRLAVQKVLTKEQRQKAVARMKQHQGNQREWMGNGPENCQCGGNGKGHGQGRGKRQGQGRGNGAW